MAKPLPKSACMWHAFHALKENNSDEVKKPKLKVLTHNIGNCLGLIKTEEKLENNYETDTVSFPSYMGFIHTEIINNIPKTDDQNRSTRRSSLEKVDDVCWMLCCRGYMKRSPIVLDLDNLFILWKIFNTLCECDDEGIVVTPIVVDYEEVKLFALDFCRIAGIQFDSNKFGEISKDIAQFQFEEFANYFEMQLCHPDLVSVDTTSSALKELQDEIIYEVIKKGMLVKKGHALPTLKERWFTLTPIMMRYYSGSDEKDMKGEIPISPPCKVDSLADAPRGTYRFKFKLTIPGKVFDIHAPDLKSRGEWQTAIRTAVDYCKQARTPQERLRAERRTEREERRRRERETERKRKQSLADIDSTRQELEQEKRAREAAQLLAEEREKQMHLEEENVAKARKELAELEKTRRELLAQTASEKEKLEIERELNIQKQKILDEEVQLRKEAEQRLIDIGALRDDDKRQLAELWSMKEELETLLEKEREAKRDEEIVRTLQARMLLEEEEKRDELEKMQQQLKRDLEQEQSVRVGLEDTHRQQQQLLLQEQQQMLLLQDERRKVEQDLKDKTLKLAEAETAKLEMAERLKKKEKNKPPIVARLAAHLPDIDEWTQISHRGLGAFCKDDFNKPRLSDTDGPPRPVHQAVESDSGRASEGSISPVFDKEDDDLAEYAEPESDGQCEHPVKRSSAVSAGSSTDTSAAAYQEEDTVEIN